MTDETDEIRSPLDDPEIVALVLQLSAARRRTDAIAKRLGMTSEEARARFGES